MILITTFVLKITLYIDIHRDHPINERWCYNVMLSLIAWMHTQNDACNLDLLTSRYISSNHNVRSCRDVIIDIWCMILHDLVYVVPMFMHRNKTWYYLYLILRWWLWIIKVPMSTWWTNGITISDDFQKIISVSICTEIKMLSFWWNFHHWLYRKLSFWQPPMQPVMKLLSKWRPFHFSVRHI